MYSCSRQNSWAFTNTDENTHIISVPVLLCTPLPFFQKATKRNFRIVFHGFTLLGERGKGAVNTDLARRRTPVQTKSAGNGADRMTHCDQALGDWPQVSTSSSLAFHFDWTLVVVVVLYEQLLSTSSRDEPWALHSSNCSTLLCIRADHCSVVLCNSVVLHSTLRIPTEVVTALF